MSMVEFERVGQGEPLLLVHGTGLSRQEWEPLVDLLAPRRDLLLVDLPGHGASPSPPPDFEPTPPGYARVLATLLDELGFQDVHVAGNSVGGWTALELAKLGRARSVVALAPAGLWPGKDPLAAWGQLWLNFQLTRLFRPLVPAVVRTAAGRAIFFRSAVGDPSNIPPEAAVQLALSFQRGAGVRDHLLAMRRIVGFRGGESIEVPVAVVWGERERILRHERVLDHLPVHTREIELPGCGHVMSWDDPTLVAQTILAGTEESTAALAVSDEAADSR